MVIALAGEKGSGKTTISNILVKYGYKKFSFAGYLKLICSEVWGYPAEWNNSLEEKENLREVPFIWNQHYCNILSMVIQEDLVFNKDEREIPSVRVLLQYIGSEVLRAHRISFHIDKTMKSLVTGENYVCDDLRYPNEFDALQKIDARLMYVTSDRPKSGDTHSSETSLSKEDFPEQIINSISKGTGVLEKYVVETFNLGAVTA